MSRSAPVSKNSTTGTPSISAINNGSEGLSDGSALEKREPKAAQLGEDREREIAGGVLLDRPLHQVACGLRKDHDDDCRSDRTDEPGKQVKAPGGDDLVDQCLDGSRDCELDCGDDEAAADECRDAPTVRLEKGKAPKVEPALVRRRLILCRHRYTRRSARYQEAIANSSICPMTFPPCDPMICQLRQYAGCERRIPNPPVNGIR